MKKILLTGFLLSIAGMCSFAQVDTIRLKNDGSNVSKKTVTDRPLQAVYFGFGGSGPIFSVNYDRRFSKRLNGFGFTAGLGFFGGSGYAIFSIPTSLNYLFGRKDHFLELAAGATFATGHFNLFNTTGSPNENFVFGHINLGYRYQQAEGGFFARVGISPLFFNGVYATSFYLGLGSSF